MAHPSPQTASDPIRDLIAAAEQAGWDIGENKTILDRARQAYDRLAVVAPDLIKIEGDL